LGEGDAVSEFFILSLKWSRRRSGLLTWWDANNSGYRFRIDGTRCPAGRYTREQIEADLRYYHDGVNTLAVPCEAVIAASIRVKDCASRDIDYEHVEDRVVPYSKLAEMKRAAKAWRKPVPRVIT
jgi:hypothetical protein